MSEHYNNLYKIIGKVAYLTIMMMIHCMAVDSVS